MSMADLFDLGVGAGWSWIASWELSAVELPGDVSAVKPRTQSPWATVVFLHHHLHDQVVSDVCLLAK